MSAHDVAAFLAQNALKATVVFAAASAVLVCCRRQSAALRHAISTGAVVIVLLLPVATLMSRTSGTPGLAVRVDVLTSEAWHPLLLRSGEPGDVAPRGVTREAGASPRRPVAVAAGIALWMAGAFVLFARLVRDLIRAQVLIHRARPVEAWRIGSVPASSSPVRVASSGDISTPMTAGLFRSVILLPARAIDPSSLEMRAALEHERAHVERHDTLFYVIGRLVVVCHWMNPLAWLTLAQLRRDAERACDDRALESGIAPVDYASVLVAAAAATTRRDHPLPLGMAAVDDLESRLTSILQPNARRERCSRPVVASVATFTVIGVALGGLSLYATIRASDDSSVPAAERVSGSVSNVPKVDTSESGTRSSSSRAKEAGEAAETQPNDDALIKLLHNGTRQVPAHAQDLVAERSRWALSQVRDRQLVAPLIELLLSADERDAAFAAWTLGLADRERAFEPLLRALQHPSWRVRAEAAAALSRWADPRAAAAMRDVISDEAWQVRLEVASYFGALGDAGSLDVLRSFQNDPHTGVRMEADALLASLRGGR